MQMHAEYSTKQDAVKERKALKAKYIEHETNPFEDLRNLRDELNTLKMAERPFNKPGEGYHQVGTEVTN